jgi:hypothetical protein
VHVGPLSTGGGVAQDPARHVRPLALQSAQALPAVPHASAVVPEAHAPFALQHPWHVVEHDGASGAASLVGAPSGAPSATLSPPPVYPSQSSTSEQPPDEAAIVSTPTCATAHSTRRTRQDAVRGDLANKGVIMNRS